MASSTTHGSAPFAPSGDSGTNKPRVFLSSTIEDLAEHRRKIADNLTALNLSVYESSEVKHLATLWQRFDSRFLEPLFESDIYVLLLGRRYGTPIRRWSGISGTHLEWNKVRRLRRVKRLVFLHRQHSKALATDGPYECCEQAQASFIATLRHKVAWEDFDPQDASDTALKVIVAVNGALTSLDSERSRYASNPRALNPPTEKDRRPMLIAIALGLLPPVAVFSVLVGLSISRDHLHVTTALSAFGGALLASICLVGGYLLSFFTRPR
jgi:hypothetical protein